jgi:pimeloyl-ACP methyl ester carboxylesterase
LTGRVCAEEGVVMTNWIEGDLQTDHGDFRLYRTGRAGRPSVLLAHGLSDSAKCWWRVAGALAEQYDVIAYDARNHGASSTVAGSSTGLVDDLAAIIDTAGLGRPMLIGHSVGARTMAEFAASHPGAASALVLVDPPWTANQEHDGTIPDDRREIVRAWLVSLGEATEHDLAGLARQQHPDWPEVEYSTWIESKQQVRPEAADALDSVGWGSVVSALACRTLLLHGDVDRGGIVDDAVARRVGELNSLVTCRRIDGAGHNIHRENFIDFIDEVAEFLRST